MINGFRRTDTRNDIFPLCIHQEFTHQLLSTGGRITRERNTCTGIITCITEDHGLYVDSRTPVSWNFIHTTVINSTRIVPRTENSLNRLDQLICRILREIRPFDFFIESFISFDHFLKIFRCKLRIQLDTLLFFHFIDDFFEFLLRDLHDDIREHLNETTV